MQCEKWKEKYEQVTKNANPEKPGNVSTVHFKWMVHATNEIRSLSSMQ